MHHGMGGGMGCPVCGGGMGHGCKCGKGLGGIKMMFKMMPWKIMMHHEDLGISEDQVAQMRKRHTQAMKQMVQIKSQMKMAEIDIKDAVMREEIDMGTAEAKIKELGNLKAEKMLALVNAMNDMRHIFSDEQRKRIKEMVMGWFRKGGAAAFGDEEEQEGEAEEEE